MSIENILSQATALAVKELYGADVEPQSIVPQATRKEFEGNLTIVVFPFSAPLPTRGGGRDCQMIEISQAGASVNE